MYGNGFLLNFVMIKSSLQLFENDFSTILMQLFLAVQWLQLDVLSNSKILWPHVAFLIWYYRIPMIFIFIFNFPSGWLCLFHEGPINGSLCLSLTANAFDFFSILKPLSPAPRTIKNYHKSINQFFKDHRVDTLCTMMHQAIWLSNFDLKGPGNYSFSVIKISLFRNRTPAMGKDLMHVPAKSPKFLLSVGRVSLVTSHSQNGGRNGQIHQQCMVKDLCNYLAPEMRKSSEYPRNFKL